VGLGRRYSRYGQWAEREVPHVVPQRRDFVPFRPSLMKDGRKVALIIARPCTGFTAQREIERMDTRIYDTRIYNAR